MRKRLVWFPFLLIAITMILAVTIVLVDKNRGELAVSIDTYQQAEENIQGDGMDPEIYRSAVHSAMIPVWNVIETGVGSEDMIKEVRDHVLALRVSSADRDVHILLVAGLNTLITGLAGNQTAIADAQVRFSELASKALWMKSAN